MNGDQEIPSGEELRQLARETHYALRRKLIELKENPPTDPNVLIQLRSEIGSLNRQLFGYHMAMYQAETGQKLNLLSSLNKFVLKRDAERFYQWRLPLLQGIGETSFHAPGSDSEYLFKKDKTEWTNIFRKKPYTEEDPGNINHWSIICRAEFVGEDKASEFIWALDTPHSDLSYADLIAGFMEGIETNFYVGAQIEDTERGVVFTNPGMEFEKKPNSRLEGGKPQWEINGNGEVVFNRIKI